MLLFLILFFLWLLPLGQFGRLTPADGQVILYLNDLLLAPIIFLWLLQRFLIKRSFILPAFVLPLSLFVLWVLFGLFANSVWLSLPQLLQSGSYLLRFVGYALLSVIVYHIITDAKEPKSTSRVIENALIIAGLLVVFLGFGQLILLPDFSEMARLEGWDPHQGRLLSTFFDPNFVGGFLLLPSLLLVGRLREITGAKRLFWAGGFIALILALLFTFSRSSYLALTASLLVFVLWRMSRLLPLLLLFSVLLLLFLPRWQERIVSLSEGLDQSAASRLVSWERGLAVFSQSPVWGIGFNAYRFAQSEAGYFEGSSSEGGGKAGGGTDSSLLLVLSTTGGVGFLFFAWFLGQVLLHLWPRLKDSDLILVFFAFSLGLLLHSQFVNSFFYPWIMAQYFVMVGISVGTIDASFQNDSVARRVSRLKP